MIKIIVSVLLFLLPTTAISGEYVSGTIGVHSDYVWRGYSQNDGEVALSAGIGVAFKGVTLAAWASQVDFNDDAKYEYDLVANYDYWINDEPSSKMLPFMEWNIKLNLLITTTNDCYVFEVNRI